VLGVQLGSFAGFHMGQRTSARWLKSLMAAVLMGVALMMFVRSIG
jgi:uncharacterized membrane protein YfcA